MHPTTRSLIRRRVHGLLHPLVAVLLAMALLFSCPSSAAFAAGGDLDPTFDGDGKLTTNLGLNTSQAQAMAIQSDGKIVVAGYASNGVNYDVALARYNTDGSLDTTFSADGKLTTAIGTFNDYARAGHPERRQASGGGL
jgi:uncharacterized delta-60 repeat protein